MKNPAMRILRGLGWGALGGLAVGTGLGLLLFIIGAIYGAPIGTFFGAANGLCCGLALAAGGARLETEPGEARIVSALSTLIFWLLVALYLLSQGAWFIWWTVACWLVFLAVSVALAMAFTPIVVLGVGGARARRQQYQVPPWPAPYESARR